MSSHLIKRPAPPNQSPALSFLQSCLTSGNSHFTKGLDFDEKDNHNNAIKHYQQSIEIYEDALKFNMSGFNAKTSPKNQSEVNAIKEHRDKIEKHSIMAKGRVRELEEKMRASNAATTALSSTFSMLASKISPRSSANNKSDKTKNSSTNSSTNAAQKPARPLRPPTSVPSNERSYTGFSRDYSNTTSDHYRPKTASGGRIPTIDLTKEKNKQKR